MPDFSDRIRQLSPEKREMLFRRWSTTEDSSRLLIPRRRDSGDAHLSFAQQRLWFLEQLAPQSGAYLIPLLLRFRGPLHVEALQDSLQEVVRRHDVLRASFPVTPHGPRQRIAPHVDCRLPMELLASHSPSSRENELASAARQELRRPFFLEHGALLRTKLWRIDSDIHALLILIHHILADGWSIGILLHELATFYTARRLGLPPSLKPLPLQYPDFADWQQNAWTSVSSHPEWPYWKERMVDLPPPRLPHDRPRPATPQFAGSNQHLNLSTPLSNQIRDSCRHHQVTLFSYLLAACQILLEQFSGQAEIAIATPVAGRSHVQLEPLIGCFINTLVIRSQVHKAGSFREQLARAHDDALGAFAHQELPFEKLVEELRPTRDAARMPLVQVLFAVQNTPARDCDFLGLQLEVVELEAPTARFDLEFNVWDTPSGIRLILTYNSALFESSTMERLLQHYHQLIECVTATPEIRLCSTPQFRFFASALPLLQHGRTEATGFAEAPSFTERGDLPDALPRERLLPYHSVAELETAIARSWQDLLATSCVSPDDDFFALGGNSLTAARATRWLSDFLGVPLEVRGLFETRTVRRFALHADAVCWVRRTNPTHPDDEELAF